MIVLCGESGSGKSTIENELAKRGLSKIVSYTTRLMRTGEIDGIDYHYVHEDEFNKLLSKDFFAEYSSYNGYLYGIAKDDCEGNSVVVVEPHGFRQLKKRFDLDISSFYIKVPQKVRLIRLASRDDNVMEIFRRIVSDQGVFQGMEDEVDYVVSGEASIEDITNFILERVDDRNNDQYCNRS